MPGNFLNKYVLPVATMSGAMIGVGFLSLPYVAMKAGIAVAMLYLVVLTAIVIVIDLVFAKISLKTPDFKRFPGFCGYYLGNWGKAIAFLSSIIGFVGVLLIYLIIGSEFLKGALEPYLGGNILFYALAYFALSALAIFFGIKVVAKIEFASVVLLFLALLFIAVKGFPHFHFSNIFAQNDFKNIFLPYGPIMFALWGTGIIPEIEEMLRGNKKELNKVVLIGTLIPAAIYAFFIIMVLGISGSATTESAFIGLKNVLGDGIMSLALLLGAMVTFVAYVVSGLTFKKVLAFDLKIKEWQALVIACFTPLVLFLLGMKSFVPLISFIGGFLLGIDGLLILLMYKKIGGKKIIIYPLALIFILGIIYEIIYFSL